MHDPDADSEYEVVALGDYWGLLSLLFFAAALAARYLLRLLPPHLRGYASIPPLVLQVVPVLALLGVGAALLGLRRSRKNPVTRIALLLNVVVLVLSGLLLGGLWLWFRSRS